MSILMSQKYVPGTTLKNFPLLRQNIMVLSRNYGRQLIQALPTFKAQSLILASFIQVTSRIATANYSAVKAHNTPQADHRYREAIKTTVREFLGFSLSFVFLRFIEGFFRKGINLVFGAKFSKNQSAPNLNHLKRNIGIQISQWVGGYPMKPVEDNMIANLHKAVEVIDFNVGRYKRLGSWWFRPLFKITDEKLTEAINIKHGQIKNLKIQPQDLLKEEFLRFHKNVPMLLALIPVCLVSGTLLERFTRNHSEKVVQTLSQLFSKKKDSPSEAVKPEGQSPALKEKEPVPFPAAGAVSGIRAVQPFNFLEGSAFPVASRSAIPARLDSLSALQTLRYPAYDAGGRPAQPVLPASRLYPLWS